MLFVEICEIVGYNERTDCERRFHMKIALCDDDEKELAGLKTMLHHYGAKHHKPLTYKEYTSSVELALQAPKERFDLYLLDIIMPRLTGVGLAREIRSFDKAASIIFLTTSPEFAVESYTVKATNYLMKPVQEETFFAAMDDLLHDKVEEQDHYVVLNSKIGVHKVRLSEIVFVEAQNRKVIYYTNSGEQITCADLFTSVCDELLQHREFILAHRSYLVNMNYIRTIGATDMQLSNGKSIPLAQRRVTDLKKHYLAFQMEE